MHIKRSLKMVSWVVMLGIAWGLVVSGSLVAQDRLVALDPRNQETIVNQAMSLITTHERFSGTPVQNGDSKTIGWGFTDPAVLQRRTITRAEADRILAAQIASISSYLDAVVKVPLNNNQRVALISLVHNIGVEEFSKSALLTKLNNRQYTSVSGEIQRWNKVEYKDGRGVTQTKTSPELTRRRAAEVALWLKPAK